MSAERPTAAIVIIGAEVLSAKVRDENSPYLVEGLRERGVEVLEIRTIGDGIDLIADALRALAPTVDHVFTTGGIGPTHDDVTIAGVAAAFDVPVVRSPLIERRLHDRLGARVNAAHLKMAEVPEGAEVVIDEDGLLPIVRMRNVVILPGVPSLVRWCFERLARELDGPPFYTHALLLSVPESAFAEHLAAVQAEHRAVSIGSYPRIEAGDLTAPKPPRSGGVRVKVTVDGRERTLVRAAVDAVRAGIAPEWLVGEEETVAGEAPRG